MPDSILSTGVTCPSSLIFHRNYALYAPMAGYAMLKAVPEGLYINQILRLHLFTTLSFRAEQSGVEESV